MNGNAKFSVLLGAKVTGENNIKRLGNSMQGVQGKAKNLGLAVKGVGLAFKAMFAAAAIGGITAFVKSSIDAADALGKLEVRTGIAAAKLQSYVNAGKLADVSQKQLATGLKTLARTQLEAADGVATYADAYNKLGIDVKNTDGTIKKSDQLLGEIADTFATLPDGPEKTAIALDIFGKSGADMITMLNGGKAALEEFNYQLSDKFAQNAEYYNDQVTKLGFKFEGFRMQLIDALLPALNAITESFATLFEAGVDFGPLFKIIAGSIRVVAAVTFSLIKLVDTLIKNAVAGFQIIGKLLVFDLPGAMDIFKTRFSGMIDQAKKDFAELGNIMFGTSEAPEGYGRRTGTQSTSDEADAEIEKIDIVKQLRQQILDLKNKEKQEAEDIAKIEKNNLQDLKKQAKGPLQTFIENSVSSLKDLETSAVEVSQSIGNAIGGALVNGLQSLVTGAASIKQIFADMLKNVANILAQQATQMIATYIAIGIARAFAGMGGGGGDAKVPPTTIPGGATQGGSLGGFNFGGVDQGINFTTAAQGAYYTGGFKAFNQGGVVSQPTLGLVGEGGEPEYIIPQSKMRESMSRYSRGSRGGGVIPDNRGGSASEDGGTAVAAAIDVRYTVERINSVDYVTADQFQNGMQRAASQGAQRGEQNTLKRLQMSGSTRRRLGM